MEKFLPLWIIGAPLVFAVVDRIMTPKVTGTSYGYRKSVGPDGTVLTT